MYEYRAKLDRVVDGDTVYLRVDLGFNISAIIDFRLYGINAPEPREETAEAGKAATQHLSELITPAHEFDEWPLRIRTHKRDKYGRWLVEIYKGLSEESINERMVKDGFAKEYP